MTKKKKTMQRDNKNSSNNSHRPKKTVNVSVIVEGDNQSKDERAQNVKQYLARLAGLRHCLALLPIIVVARRDANHSHAPFCNLRTCMKPGVSRGVGILPVTSMAVPAVLIAGLRHGQDARGTHGQDAHATVFIHVLRSCIIMADMG